jgi:hypothetical protein
MEQAETQEESKSEGNITTTCKREAIDSLPTLQPKKTRTKNTPPHPLTVTPEEVAEIQYVYRNGKLTSLHREQLSLSFL